MKIRPTIRLVAIGAGIAVAVSAIPIAGARVARSPIAIVIHGGAGNITPTSVPPPVQKQVRLALKQALEIGYSALKDNRSSVYACVHAIEHLESSPLFDAGRGAVLTHTGVIQLDAAIMNGKTLNAGSVAAVQHVMHPIALAEKVMRDSPHEMIVGQGAETFALEQGFKLVPDSYFYTQRTWRNLRRLLKQRGEYRPGLGGSTKWENLGKTGGTVGCVALDRAGNIAAGTSTGGLTNKHFGRVSDSAQVGDGTYANNATLGESGTGIGAYYIRLNLTKDVSDLMQYRGWGLEKAVRYEICAKLVSYAGTNTGGLIAMDRHGDIAIAFNTPGMFMGYIDTKGRMSDEVMFRKGSCPVTFINGR